MSKLELFNADVNLGLHKFTPADDVGDENNSMNDYADDNVTESIETVENFEVEEYVDPVDPSQQYQPCNCLPLCTSLHYDVETSQSNLDLDQYIKANSMHDEEAE